MANFIYEKVTSTINEILAVQEAEIKQSLMNAEQEVIALKVAELEAEKQKKIENARQVFEHSKTVYNEEFEHKQTEIRESVVKAVTETIQAKYKDVIDKLTAILPKGE